MSDVSRVGRDDYLVTITSSLYIFILTEGGISVNQQSTHDNRGGRRGCHQKGRIGNNFSQQQ